MSTPENGGSNGLGPTARSPGRWYCVSRCGVAMLCVDEDDARKTSAHCNQDWPGGGSHRAVQLVEAPRWVPVTEALPPVEAEAHKEVA